MLRRKPVLIPLALACTLLITLAVTATPEGVPFNELWDAIGDLQEASVPDGTIVMWSGKISGIPTGWALCDGNDGTPDLTDQFIMSVSGSSEDPGGMGGSDEHSHAGGKHTHHVPIATHSHYVPSASTGGPYGTVEVDKPDLVGGTAYVGTSSHYHYVPSRQTYSGGAATTSGAGSADTGLTNHLPPYFKLAFIIKQ